MKGNGETAALCFPELDEFGNQQDHYGTSDDDLPMASTLLGCVSKSG
jgi:hypothetical protein